MQDEVKSASPRMAKQPSAEATPQDVTDAGGEVVNPSGHRDQLRRQFGLLSSCGQSVTIDNAWVAMGLSLNVALSNGGPAGVIYELIVAVFYYGFIAASIAELASAIPSAGGVYHWASITPGPRAGRVLGFYAGFLNFLSWIFGLASIVYVLGEAVVQSYALYHPDLVVQPWHIFVVLVLVTLLGTLVVVVGNRALPLVQSVSGVLVLAAGVVTIVVLVTLPGEHASSASVWTGFDANNLTGWPAGLAFLTGVLNGAFTIGVPDSVTHMAEDMPHPRRDLPRAIAVQWGCGCVSALAFVVALFYGISDLPSVIASDFSFPLAGAYRQVTGSDAATVGLLALIFCAQACALVAWLLTLSRTWWALARDNAVPFSKFFARLDERRNCPIPATLFCGALTVAICTTTLGSKTGFADILGSFVILSTTSYCLAIAPMLVTGRRYLPPGGTFSLGKAGRAINAIAVVCMVFFNVIFCLPYAYPTTADLMNYNSVILVGAVALITLWWLVHGRRHYPVPKLVRLYDGGEWQQS